MENILLEFKNLVTEFHTEGTIVKAVNGVSFTLNKGEQSVLLENQVRANQLLHFQLCD